MSVQGMLEIKRAVAHHQDATAKGLRVGLYNAGLFLQRESQKYVPVEFGTLKASATTRMEGEGLDSAVIVGYGTDYAVYVHELVRNKHAPGKFAKFLSYPLIMKRDRIAEIVKEGIENNAE